MHIRPARTSMTAIRRGACCCAIQKSRRSHYRNDVVVLHLQAGRQVASTFRVNAVEIGSAESRHRGDRGRIRYDKYFHHCHIGYRAGNCRSHTYHSAGSPAIRRARISHLFTRAVSSDACRFLIAKRKHSPCPERGLEPLPGTPTRCECDQDTSPSGMPACFTQLIQCCSWRTTSSVVAVHSLTSRVARKGAVHEVATQPGEA